MTNTDQYVGEQKILREEKLDNGIVAVTLEIEEVFAEKAGTSKETVLFREDVLETLKAYETPNLNQMRADICRGAISEMTGVLMNHAIPERDLEYCIQTVVKQIDIAKAKSFAKRTGKTPEQFTIADLADELKGL